MEVVNKKVDLALGELKEIKEMVRKCCLSKSAGHREEPPINKPTGKGLVGCVDANGAAEKLGIGRSTFYSRVRNILLHPILRIGNRDYYDLEEINDLFRRHREKYIPYRRLNPVCRTCFQVSCLDETCSIAA